MAHKTTVTLPDDIYAQWKTAGLPLTEVIRRGLDGTGDTARHTATEARLAALEARHANVEHRLAQLETTSAGDNDGPFLAEPVDPEELERQNEEWDRQHEERREREAHERHDLLLTRVKRLPGEPCTVTLADAMAVFHRSRGTVLQQMHEMTDYGLAHQLDRKQGTGEPYRWVIEEPDGDNG
jgi:monoamine oxidase